MLIDRGFKNQALKIERLVLSPLIFEENRTATNLKIDFWMILGYFEEISTLSSLYIFAHFFTSHHEFAPVMGIIEVV